jgi:membrane protease YdiL (CAAX protease family)
MLLFVGILIRYSRKILFRGLILGELNKAMRQGIAVFLQALIFGLSHFNIIQGIYAFLLGLSSVYLS